MATKEKMLELADTLSSGAGSDIWYNAYEYGEYDTQEFIDSVQTAMNDAADVLREQANATHND